jgi:hypothetical protein
LIYVAGQASSYVLSYTTGKLVGSIDSGGQAACSDKNGNVFLTGGDEVLEYSHGGTTPVATLELPGESPESVGCASDPISGNLAVTFGTTDDDQNVAIFPDGQGTPTVYQSGINSQFSGYDDEGNLFVDGFNQRSVGLAELPNGSGSFNVITIDQSIGGDPWSIQWDGQYITIEGITQKTFQLSRLQISGSTATIVGTTKSSRALSKARGSWIFGKKVLVPFGKHGEIGFWDYPHGGKAERLLSKKNFGQGVGFFYGLTVSVGPTR